MTGDGSGNRWFRGKCGRGESVGIASSKRDCLQETEYRLSEWYPCEKDFVGPWYQCLCVHVGDGCEVRVGGD